jgi:hypothetical protein
MSVTGTGPNFALRVSVANLPVDGSGVLTISAVGVSNTRTDDPRCVEVGLDMTCVIDGDDPTPVDLTVTAPQGGRVTARITTIRDDPDLSNNQVDAVLP